MKIYFVRHGESEFNVKELFQDKDVSLTQKGKEQAQFLAKRFSKIPIDVIISSPAERAKQTSDIIAQKLGKKIIFLDSANERRMPKESIGKYAFSEEVMRIKKAMRENADNPDWHYSDEENFSEFKGRIKKLFDYLNDLKEKNVLVVSHGGPIRMTILFMVFGENFEPEVYFKFIDVFRLINTGITMCEKEDNSHWNLWTFNDHVHLG